MVITTRILIIRLIKVILREIPTPSTLEMFVKCKNNNFWYPVPCCLHSFFRPVWRTIIFSKIFFPKNIVFFFLIFFNTSNGLSGKDQPTRISSIISSKTLKLNPGNFLTRKVKIFILLFVNMLNEKETF